MAETKKAKITALVKNTAKEKGKGQGGADRKLSTAMAKAPMKTTPEKKSTEKKTKEKNIGITKSFTKNSQTCRVTFRLPKIVSPDGKCVCIVGDFNRWDIRANPMKKQKNGDHTITLELEKGKEYQYRYLIGETHWENDWNADKYVKSPYGDCDNSVVVL